MKLSPHFTLDEFLRSQTATRYGIDMTPPAFVVDNIVKLVSMFLHPIRVKAGSPLIITSGYRPKELNDRIRGSATSAHIDGRAADFYVIGQTPYETCLMIRELGLPFDQLIHEFGGWVHLGISGSPREELLTAFKSGGRTTYRRGIFTMEEVAYA